MALIKYRTNDDLYPSFSNVWSSFFNNEVFDPINAAASLPAVNIKETKENFQVELAAPGMKKDDFNVVLEKNLLKISSKKEEKNEDGKFTRKEFSYQSFLRTFTLPNTVDSESIEASYQDGILKLMIPKKEEAKEKPVRTINVG